MELNIKSSMNIRHCRNRWIAIFFFFFFFFFTFFFNSYKKFSQNGPLKFFAKTTVLIDNISYSNTFVSCRLVTSFIGN